MDGVRIDDIAQQGIDAFLQALEQDLRAGSYRPQPGLRVYIPKPDGRQRPLGMPTVRDRVGQQACKSVIEPLCAANVQDTSYGFRPQRSATQAVKVIKEQRVSNGYVVEVDIERYFGAPGKARRFQRVQFPPRQGPSPPTGNRVLGTWR